jgi:hypothetical protein
VIRFSRKLTSKLHRFSNVLFYIAAEFGEKKNEGTQQFQNFRSFFISAVKKARKISGHSHSFII